MIAAAWTIASLIAALDGVGPERERAIEALADTTMPVVEAVIDSAGYRGRDGAVESLARREPAAIDRLAEIARLHPKTATRRSAIRHLGKTAGSCDLLATLFGSGDDSVVLAAMAEREDCRLEAIAPFLSSTDHDARRRALVAYAASGGDVTKLAVERLTDPHHGVREAAGRLLVSAGEDGVTAIVAAIERLGGVGLTRGIRVLGEIGGAKAEVVLTEVLKTGDRVHRRAAAEAIARTGSADALPVVRARLAADPDGLVKEALLAAQRSIEERTR